jgi:HPr kinase/phosphorylase
MMHYSLASASPVRVHASCVLAGRGAVLLRGGPGCGKSGLALELLAHDGPNRTVRLVADDAVDLLAANGRLVALAPAPTIGLLEVRGVGLIGVSCEPRAVVLMVADLVAPEDAARLPEAEDARVDLCGVALPRFALPVGRSGHARRILAALDCLASGSSLPVLPDQALPSQHFRA